MSHPVSAAIARQHVRTVALVGAIGRRCEVQHAAGETLTIERFGAAASWPRGARQPFRNPELLQHGRQDAADNGQAAEDREVGVFGHRRASDWEDAL